MKLFTRPYLSQLPWHVLAIAVFVETDLKSFLDMGMRPNWGMLIPVYIINIVFFYFSAYRVIPMIKRINKSPLIQICYYTFYVGCYAYVLFVLIYILYLINNGTYRGWITGTEYLNLVNRSSLFFILAAFLALFLAKIKEKNQKIENDRLLAEAQREKLEMENLLLRSQLNPHFINNGLFYIQNESNKINPALAVWIGSFANIVNYHLNTSGNGRVSLDDDLDKVHEYIHSQQRLLHDKIKIHFRRDIDERSGEAGIYPLLFMSLVENMFKHGQLRTNEKPAIVMIYRDQGNLVFHSENEIATDAPSVPKGGIGLASTKRRLELLYPDRHSFDISIKNSRYVVDLKIGLWKK